MRKFFQLFIISGFLLLGNGIVSILHLPFPGSVAGMIMLLAAMLTGLIQLEWIENMATFQIKHLTLLFLPLVIGVFLSPNLIPLLSWHFIIAILFSSFICLLGTAFFVEWFEKIKRRSQ
ncbi:CidA/LrgA family protein [Peribacillus saganii]|uniref:CidA/LrgA family protein n=1 Tax=Peribacillus saganii TaxID=2303992 RepID=A0A372LS96_9BACI|nr:CidA/LrgA family protein [Peribacillus saganii]RFU71058.1 CidA/LrgA family protein [Peribacillus saganii]